MLIMIVVSQFPTSLCRKLMDMNSSEHEQDREEEESVFPVNVPDLYTAFLSPCEAKTQIIFSL